MNRTILILFSILTGLFTHADSKEPCLKEEMKILDSLFTRYTRPFTFLGIGEDSEFEMKDKIADYPESTFVFLGKSSSQEDRLSALKNVIYLKHSISFQELKNLALCEHVDVLLFNTALEAFNESYEQILHVLRQMAHIVVIALPTGNHIYKQRDPFRLVKTTYIHPKKKRWSYEIHCDYEYKFLKKTRPNWSTYIPWEPGINMMTYLLFNGSIPSRREVLQNLPIDLEHTDWLPNNMIVQGSKILLIDKDDPISGTVEPDGGVRFARLNAYLTQLILETENSSLEEVKNSFISIYGWGDYFNQTEVEE